MVIAFKKCADVWSVKTYISHTSFISIVAFSKKCKNIETHAVGKIRLLTFAFTVVKVTYNVN